MNLVRQAADMLITKQERKPEQLGAMSLCVGEFISKTVELIQEH